MPRSELARAREQTLCVRPEELNYYFNGHPQNVGILLGEPSAWVVDVDLDTPEA